MDALGQRHDDSVRQMLGLLLAAGLALLLLLYPSVFSLLFNQ